MERRKFMIGIGSLAAGGAAATGTGAFTSMSAERSANINVVNDSSGLISIRPGQSVDSDVVRTVNDGELTIDFAAGQGGGVNNNSLYQVGVFITRQGNYPENAVETKDTTGVGGDAAFLISNHDTTAHQLEVSFEPNAEDLHGAELYFQFVRNSGNWPEKLHVTDSSGDSFTTPDRSPLGSGNDYFAVLLVDTTGSDGTDPADIDLSGTLSIEATD